MKTERELLQLCDAVRQTAFEIHKYHKSGHMEKVYENALAHRLRKSGFDVQQQFAIKVFDEDGTTIGEFFVDLFVAGQLIVELKAARAISSEHIAQLLGYLKSTRIEHGLIINFGAPIFEIKKYVLTQTSA